MIWIGWVFSTDGLRKAKEKFTGKLYVSEDELKKAGGKNRRKFPISNYEPLVVTGEQDPVKLKAIRAYVEALPLL